jgi:hypothetical protein
LRSAPTPHAGPGTLIVRPRQAEISSGAARPGGADQHLVPGARVRGPVPARGPGPDRDPAEMDWWGQGIQVLAPVGAETVRVRVVAVVS